MISVNPGQVYNVHLLVLSPYQTSKYRWTGLIIGSLFFSKAIFLWIRSYMYIQKQKQISIHNINTGLILHVMNKARRQNLYPITRLDGPKGFEYPKKNPLSKFFLYVSISRYPNLKVQKRPFSTIFETICFYLLPFIYILRHPEPIFYILIINEKVLVLCEKWIEIFIKSLCFKTPWVRKSGFYESICLSICRSYTL